MEFILVLFIVGVFWLVLKGLSMAFYIISFPVKLAVSVVLSIIIAFFLLPAGFVLGIFSFLFALLLVCLPLLVLAMIIWGMIFIFRRS